MTFVACHWLWFIQRPLRETGGGVSLQRLIYLEFPGQKFHIQSKLGIYASKIPISPHDGRVSKRTTGRYVTVSTRDEPFRAFVPSPLPPEPAVALDAALEKMHGEAQMALGRLDGIVSLLPAPEQFLYAYVRKEAVASSQIEGTQSSLSDLLAYEITAAPGVPVEDVREVSDCVAAYEHAQQRMSDGDRKSVV